jgi:hypothetical protein
MPWPINVAFFQCINKVSLPYVSYLSFFSVLDTKDHNIDPSNQVKKFNRLTDIAEEQGNIDDPFNPHAKGTISDLYNPDAKGKISDNYHTKGYISNADNPNAKENFSDHYNRDSKGDYLSIFLCKICC